MKKGIIIYKSKYGATKKYADWIAERTGFPCIEIRKITVQMIKEYDTIIFGGGIYASGIAGLSFLRKNYELMKSKQIIVFCVGASPFDKKTFDEVYQTNFKNNFKNIPCFYCRGAWDEDSMTFKDRTLCKLLQKAVSKKDPADYEPWQTALMCAVGQKCDWTDKSYLEPLFDSL